MVLGTDPNLSDKVVGYKDDITPEEVVDENEEEDDDMSLSVIEIEQQDSR